MAARELYTLNFSRDINLHIKMKHSLQHIADSQITWPAYQMGVYRPQVRSVVKAVGLHRAGMAFQNSVQMGIVPVENAYLHWRNRRLLHSR